MTSYTIGRQAEAVAAACLRKCGFKIVAQNWRTRYCEIDIVGKRASVAYFVEVKYRSTARQGDGFDYITSSKLRQMQRAADFWVANNNWSGDYRLAVMAITGPQFNRRELRLL